MKKYKKKRKNILLNGYWIAAAIFLCVFLGLYFLKGIISSGLNDFVTEKAVNDVINELSCYEEYDPSEDIACFQCEKVKLIRVVDGDTIVVNLNDEDVTVRLIGVDAPESVNPDELKNTAEGVESSDFLKEFLSDYEEVYLDFDSDIIDDYGRVLAYVWLCDPYESGELEIVTAEEVKEKMLQGILLSNGYAKTMKVLPNIKYFTLFEEIEAEYLAN